MKGETELTGSRKLGRNLHAWPRRLFCLILLLGVLLAALSAASSQEGGTPQASEMRAEQATQSSEPQADKGSSPPTSSTQPETEADKIAKEKKKKAHRGSIVAAPLPIVSPALGAGIIPVLGYIFPLSEKDKISRPSVIGAGGLITDNGTRGWGVGGQLFMKENRYQVQAGFGDGNLNYNLYGIGIAAGNAGLKLPLTQSGRAFFGEAMRNVGWKFFVGPRLFIGDSFVTIRENNGEAPLIPPDVGLHTKLVALGFVVTRDTSSNRFYPLTGTFLKFTSDFFAQGLGSKYSFQRYRFTFNKYGSLSVHQVLAYNLFICGTGGNPPFYGNCIYGANNELRGYEAGRYLDRFMVATQLEYRLTLPKRFGFAGFAGIGGVAPGADQFRSKNFLPDVGVGLRYELSKKYHVNLRADVAQGKNSHTWGLGVGEAF